VADAARLPFREAQFERIECDAVLEHVRDPVAVRDEIFRTLAPGGYVHVGVPFNHPYHGYPLDFQRWTRLGLETFMSRFEIVDTGIRTGPAATWLLTTLEFLKIVVRGTPGKVLGAAAGWVLWPVRYVDLLLYRREEAHVLANTICVLARKPVAGQSQPADR
jgi:SAM-dependent methyltransferase